MPVAKLSQSQDKHADIYYSGRFPLGS